MELVRWNPWNEMRTFRGQVGRLWDTLSLAGFDASGDTAPPNWKPAVDILESDGKVVIQAELPGVKREDISVDVQEGVLTLKGERKEEKETKESNYYRRERFSGTFQRQFSLANDLDHEHITADFKDGLLKVEIPKREEEKPKQITVH